jgi:MFS transporter, MHS family, proline/betaine transporter
MNKLKLIICAICSNCFEVYDFVIYQLLSIYISKHFFDHNSEHSFFFTQLVFILTTVFSRPIGGLIFGYISDSKGRKGSLEKSILMSALCTGMIGLIPSYQTIGVFSTLALILLRFLQGISFGGEHGTSVCFLLEHSSPKSKGALSSFCCFGQQAGMLLATIAASNYSIYASNSRVSDQLWRIMFIFSFAFSFFGYWVKKETNETIDFLLDSHFRKQPVLPISQFKTIISSNKKLILSGFFIVAFGTFANYAIFIMGNQYLQKYADALPVFNYINYIMSFLLILFIPVFGYFSDKIGRKTMISHSIVIIAPLSLPFFQPLQSEANYGVLVIAILLTISCGAYFSVTPLIIAESLPIQYRCISYAIFYSVPAAIVSSVTPFISHWAIDINPVYISYVIIILAVCSMLSLKLLDEPINRYNKISIYSYEFLKP